jgi:Transposase
MAITESRREFDEDFKENAVRLVRTSGKPLAQVARDLGVNSSTLGNWVGQAAHGRRLRRKAKLLTVTVAATVLATLLGAVLGGPSPGFAIMTAGLATTWVVCVRCWRVTRRPRPFRLVCAPVGQAFGAFLVLTVAVPGQSAGWRLIGALIGAAIFAFTSILFAGFLRDTELSRYGAFF